MIKVNDLYYNKNLVLKLFQESSDVYLLDFSNGIRLKIDTSTFNALTANSSFKPVGATYYNAAQVVAKVFARDGKHYIEFINGAELPISEADYNKLIADDDSNGDDVIVVDSYSALPTVGESGKVYVTIDTGYMYVYTGTGYSQVGGGSISASDINALLATNGDVVGSVVDDKLKLDLANDGVIELTGMSGTLSDSDYAKALADNCIIKLGTQTFYKEFDASTLITFQAFSRQAGQNSALYEFIEITKSTKAWELQSKYMVDANPSGNATEPLTKLKVAETIYSIPDGAIFKYIGVSSTAISDGSTTNPITINGVSVTAVAGNVVFYNDNEFVFDGTTWEQFGSVGFANPMTAQGDLIVGGSSGTPTRLAKGGNGYLLGVDGSGNLAYGNSLPILTTAPVSANTDGGLKIVVLNAEPLQKFDGFLYLILGS